jgi:hypothetical protein
MVEEPIYRVTFLNQGEVYEVFARSVGQGSLFGFVEIGELAFGERSRLVIDASEDRLRNEFEGVTRSYIPLHSIVRIDTVQRAGKGSIRSADGASRAIPFPLPAPSAGPKSDGDS